MDPTPLLHHPSKTCESDPSGDDWMGWSDDKRDDPYLVSTMDKVGREAPRRWQETTMRSPTSCRSWASLARGLCLIMMAIVAAARPAGRGRRFSSSTSGAVHAFGAPWSPSAAARRKGRSTRFVASPPPLRRLATTTTPPASSFFRTNQAAHFHQEGHERGEPSRDDDVDGTYSAASPAPRSASAEAEAEAGHRRRPGAAALDARGFCVVAFASALLLSLPPAPAAADTDSMFFRQADRPLLTNPLLEQYRIWDQEVADNLQYGGELERGDAANKGRVDAYPSLLVPILKMQDDLQQIKSLVTTTPQSPTNVGVDEWKRALSIVSQSQYEATPFKKVFNAYGDNIYYSDPDRANLYLGGGAAPKNEQSLAYLLRNDLLTSVQNLRSELEYCVSNAADAPVDNDAATYAAQAVDSLNHYLDLVPPRELDRARALLLQSPPQPAP